MNLQALELFGGAGGLALGLHNAGFENKMFVEWDRWACDTVRENAAAGHTSVSGWDVFEGDARTVDYTQHAGKIDVVSGGPPCQPFSLGGKARAADDPRDMFPVAAEVVRTVQPKAFLFENVRGLKRVAFANYFELIRLRLQYPEVEPLANETWEDHLARLQRVHTCKLEDQLTYQVTDTLVNAADYGVPQHRHRVFIVGFRRDVDADWSFPKATHSQDALLEAQWVSGTYWHEHKVPVSLRPEMPNRVAARVAKIKNGEIEVVGERWRTVRDVLRGMPEPGEAGTAGWKNHKLQPGARSYPGHTGSPIDEPAKALKAGGHGVPGGENMLRRVDGSIRYFSVREAARIQTFPDDYELHGSWGEAMRQLGNAVPVKLAQVVAESIYFHLETEFVREQRTLIRR